MQSTYDAIIIGAGHSGLVAAWYLADAGLSVLILERRDEVGGCCTTEEIFPGYRINSVANASHSIDPIVAKDMNLRAQGLRFIEAPLGALSLFPDGRTLPHWSDPKARASELQKFARSSTDVDGVAAIGALYRNVAKQSGVSFYEPPPSLDEIVQRFDNAKSRSDFHSFLFGNLADIIGRHIKSPEISSFFAQLGVITNLVGPYTPGSAYSLLQRPMYDESMSRAGYNKSDQFYLGNSITIGGIGNVAQAMARSARAIGVEIETSASVERILCESGRAVGVTLEDGREFRAKCVLSNADPKLTFTRLVDPDDLDHEFLSRVQDLNVKGSSAKVHLAFEGTPRFRAARTDDENAAFVSSKWRIIPSSMQTLQEDYNRTILGKWSRDLTMNGVTFGSDAEMAPEGSYSCSLTVRNVPYHLEEGDWESQREDLGKAAVEVLSQHIENLGSILAGVNVYTPLDLERKFGLLEGNAAHGDIVAGNTFNMRPLEECSSYGTPIPGLYLCGVGVWPANFISGVTGLNASRRILSDWEAGLLV